MVQSSATKNEKTSLKMMMGVIQWVIVATEVAMVLENQNNISESIITNEGENVLTDGDIYGM